MSSVGAIVAFYCFCSGGMLVLNKLAVHHIHAPAFVTLVQFIATTAGVIAGWMVGALELDALEWRKLKHFIVYIFAFSSGTWANMKVLMVANVETVIVFRSCAPICVSVLDYVFYNRALPSRRSCAAMLLIVGGARAALSRAPECCCSAPCACARALRTAAPDDAWPLGRPSWRRRVRLRLVGHEGHTGRAPDAA